MKSLKDEIREFAMEFKAMRELLDIKTHQNARLIELLRDVQDDLAVGMNPSYISARIDGAFAGLNIPRPWLEHKESGGG